MTSPSLDPSESPTPPPTTSPAPRRPAARALFQAPAPSTLDPSSTPPPSTPTLLPADDSASESPRAARGRPRLSRSARPGNDEPGVDSTPAPEPPPVAPATRALVERTAAELLQMLGEGLHFTLTSSPDERAADLWRMDEDEAARMAKPAARIVLRRAGGKVTPDLLDGFGGLLAFGRYVLNQLRAKVEIRRARGALITTEPTE